LSVDVAPAIAMHAARDVRRVEGCEALAAAPLVARRGRRAVLGDEQLRAFADVCGPDAT
jgi:hypothetical protein